MFRYVYHLIFIICFLSCNPEGIQNSRIDEYDISSQIFKNKRKLRIYLPPGYQESKEYKILYLNDGQNVFGSQELSPQDDWKVDEIVDSLIVNQIIKPIIIVGIDNAGLRQRGYEYLPWEDEYLSPPIPDPMGKKYPQFLVEEIVPFVESKYKIQEGSENRGVGGFSYGGLISLYSSMILSGSFGFLLIESPSLYVKDQQILREADSQSIQWPKKIYFGVGTNEIGLENCNEVHEDNLMAVQDIRSIMSMIQEQDSLITMELNVVECATHHYQEASKRLARALVFLNK